jgi:hypothetical protein
MYVLIGGKYNKKSLVTLIGGWIIWMEDSCGATGSINRLIPDIIASTGVIGK